MILAKDFCRSVEAVLLWGAVVQHSIDVMAIRANPSLLLKFLIIFALCFDCLRLVSIHISAG